MILLSKLHYIIMIHTVSLTPNISSFWHKNILCCLNHKRQVYYGIRQFKWYKVIWKMDDYCWLLFIRWQNDGITGGVKKII